MVAGGDDETRNPLQALVLADSFAKTFRPITLERPKALLPLCGVPAIDYTLEWLEASGVEETFVFCCAHSDQVVAHLEERWNAHSGEEAHGATSGGDERGMKVCPIVSTKCFSAGEALRFVYETHVISSDFVLMSADTVASIDLGKVLEEHRRRRKADKNAIMTMVVKTTTDRAQRRRMGDPDLVVQSDPSSQQLLEYESRKVRGSVAIDATSCFSERSALSIRGDLVDCHIDVCAPEVLGLFQDNFDYQHLRRDFVVGVLSEEELGNKIFLHEVPTRGAGYAARIRNPRSYDAISRDVASHWLWPIEAGQSSGSFTSAPFATGIVRSTTGTFDVMRGAGVSVSRSAVVSDGCQLGTKTDVCDAAHVDSSFIGRGCIIGRGAEVTGSHVFDGACIGEGARVLFSLLGNDVVVEPGAVVSEGCIVGAGVVVGKNHLVPPYSRISMFQQVPVGSDSEDDLEYAAGRSDSGNMMSDDDEESFTVVHQPGLPEGVSWDCEGVGATGKGFTWKCGARDVPSNIATHWQRFSISPRVAQAECLTLADEDFEASEAVSLPLGGSSDDSDSDSEVGAESIFHLEVRETFLRCVKEQFDQTNALIELNALKIAENRTFADCARFIFTTIVGLGFPAPKSVSPEYRVVYAKEAADLSTAKGARGFLSHLRALLGEWGDLLQRFLRNEDDQVEVLLTFEEYCEGEGVFQAERAGLACAGQFCQILHLMYDCDVVSEDAIVAWADEKEHADDADKVFLHKARPFLNWLSEASSEESDSGSESS